MLRLRRALGRAKRRAGGEGGFTLVELVMASGVMAMVLAGLAYMGTLGFADAALARNRTAATALANQALEQVRAIPYGTVALGLSSSDLAAGGDTNVSLVGGAYTYKGERIPNGNNASVPPLVPHRSTQTIDGVVYSTSVYVTYLDNDPLLKALRVTTRVSWTSKLRAASQKFVEAQTIVNVSVLSPTHPYSGPWQSSLYADSQSGEGVITISAATAGGTAISGLDLDQATMWLPTQSSGLDSEQIAAVSAKVRTSGTTIRRTNGTESTSGLQSATVGADTDPSQQKPVYQTASAPTPVTSSTSLSGSSNSLTLTSYATQSSSAGDTGTATATVLSTASNACANAANPGVNQLDSLSCGNGRTTQGSPLTAQLVLGSLGSAVLASVDSSAAPSVAHTNRDLTPQPSSCTATLGDGCVRAAHRASIGNVRIGALPAALSSIAPVGFDFLLKMDGFSRTVSAEAGVGNANPSITSSGTIQYWNGLTYTTINVAGGASTTIPLQSVVVSNALSSTTLSITGIVRTGGTTSGACPSPCKKASAQAESPFIGDIRYTVVVAGSTVADLNIHIDLGTQITRAEYTPGV